MKIENNDTIMLQKRMILIFQQLSAALGKTANIFIKMIPWQNSNEAQCVNLDWILIWKTQLLYTDFLRTSGEKRKSVATGWY